MANLKRDRLNMFKQFLNEEKKKNIELNKTCMTSRMPRVLITSKEPGQQKNRLSMTETGIQDSQKHNRLKYHTGKSLPSQQTRSEVSSRVGHNASAQANFGVYRASSNDLNYTYKLSQSVQDDRFNFDHVGSRTVKGP